MYISECTSEKARREKLPEYEQSVEKYSRDAKSLEHTVREVEKAHIKSRAPKISVSIDRDDDSGIGM